MNQIYLLHIHNMSNENYIPTRSLVDAMSELVSYVTNWWSMDMPIDEPMPLVPTREDFEYYFSDTGEWWDIVKINPTTLTAEAISDDKCWAAWENFRVGGGKQ